MPRILLVARTNCEPPNSRRRARFDIAEADLLQQLTPRALFDPSFGRCSQLLARNAATQL